LNTAESTDLAKPEEICQKQEGIRVLKPSGVKDLILKPK
jgi:hypothetical protein